MTTGGPVTGVSLQDWDVKNNVVMIKWDNTTKYESGYQIQLCDAMGKTIKTYTVKGKRTALKAISNKKLKNKPFQYRVRSYVTMSGVKQYGQWSAMAYAVPQANVTATKVSDTSVQLKWDKVAGAKSYTVYRATKENGKYKIINEKDNASFNRLNTLNKKAMFLINSEKEKMRENILEEIEAKKKEAEEMAKLSVEERYKNLVDYAETSPLNAVEDNGSEIGVITSGICYEYAKEALGDKVNYLKLGMVYPMPVELIKNFSNGLKTVYVIEELDPFIEEHCNDIGVKVIGKQAFTMLGEYTPEMIKKVILNENGAERYELSEVIPARPPVLCPGCPHRSVYYVLNKLKIHAAGDIGCYTLGAVAPLSVVDTTICMGASISSLHGMEKAKGKDYIKNWVAVIGDSTFLHTGVNSLMNMMYNKSTGTVIIMDNSTTGMTGHQDHAATGKTLLGEPTNAIDIPALCKALGVKYVTEVNAFDIATLEKVVKEEVARDEVSVIITKTPCVLLDKSKKPVYIAHPDKCKKCGMCMKPGCPAMTRNADGTIHIDDTMCTGCGLCETLCKFNAIELVKAGDK